MTPRIFHHKFGDRSHKWHGHNPIIGYFFHTFSLIIPRGEDFFMGAVRYFSGHLFKASHLREQVPIFLSQEGAHAYFHQELNKKIATHYPFREAFDKKYLSMLPFWVERSMKHQLTCTVCLEFLTYILAREILKGPIISGAEREVKSFWQWHAIEEIDHKAFVFDLYQELGFSYKRRCLTMVWIMIPLIYLLW